MADVKKTLDELQKKLAEEHREEDDLEAGLDSETEEAKPPSYKPDHANDGGLI
jgi:hypothetical protein